MFCALIGHTPEGRDAGDPLTADGVDALLSRSPLTEQAAREDREMTSTDQSARPSFVERQKEAALAEVRERHEEFRRVADIVLGANSTQRRVTEVIRLGDDFLVQIVGKGGTAWTFVVDDQRTSWVHERQENAILHLIAARHDPNPNSNHAAAFYAGRVLGVPSIAH